MNKLSKLKGAALWQRTLELTDEAFPRKPDRHSGGPSTRSHLSRCAFEQITARTFLDTFKHGPLYQGPTSPPSATSVMRTADAPADFKDPSATAHPSQSARQVAVGVAARQVVTLPQAVSAYPPQHSPAVVPVATRVPILRRLIAHHYAQTLGDVRDNFNVQSGDRKLDAAVAALDVSPLLAEEVFACGVRDEVVQQTPEDLFRRVATSATKVFAAVQEFTDWRFDQVVSPCAEWCGEVLKVFPSTVTLFGSTHYGLPLASSDVDMCIVFPAGRKIQAALTPLMDAAREAASKTYGWPPGCFSAVALEIPDRTWTLQLKYRSVSVDIMGTHVARSSEGSVRATDLLKFMMEQRRERPGFVEAVLMFKLIAHHLRFVQWHLESRGPQFKAISLVYFGLAILDHLPPPLANAAASDAGVQLLVLVRAFATFPWHTLQVGVGKDGSTRITKKTLSAEVVVLLDIQSGNSTYNVGHEHVNRCQERMKSIGSEEIPKLLEDALGAQDIPTKRAHIAARARHDAGPPPYTSVPGPLEEALPAPPYPLGAPVAPGAMVGAQTAPPGLMLGAQTGLVARRPGEQQQRWCASETAAQAPMGGGTSASPRTVSTFAQQPLMTTMLIDPPFATQNCLVASSATPSFAPIFTPQVAVSASPVPRQTLPDVLPSFLEAGMWYINGQDGVGACFELKAPENGDSGAPIVVYIPGAGGLDKKLSSQMRITPLPSWSVIFSVAGNYRVRTPDYLIQALAFLRRVTASARNFIVICGMSRGGAWILDILKENVDKCDAAIALAPYPWTKDPWNNEVEAKQLMQVGIPLLLVHFNRDEFCNSLKFPQWYGCLALGMSTAPGPQFGQRALSVVSVVCDGSHVVSDAVFYSLAFEKLSDAAPYTFWQQLWEAIAVGRR